MWLFFYGEIMKRIEMIKNRNEFSDIITNGKYVKDDNFAIYYKDNENNTYPKFGIAVKKSIGKANVRNKLKRKTRAVIDNNKKEFKNKKDYIIMIRRGCLINKYSTLNDSIINLLERIK